MGVLTPEVKSAAVEKLDDLIKLKGAAEMLDGFVIKIIVGLLDDKVFAKAPEEYHDEINEAVRGIVTGEVDDFPEIFDDILAGAIPTPLVDGSETEKALYNGFLQIVVALLKLYVYKDDE